MNPLHSSLNRVIHADCIPLLKTFPSGTVDLVVTDPPYLTQYKPRDGRRVANDNNPEWLQPAFAEIYRVLKPNSYCFSFYGWPQVDRFMGTWKQVGFVPVSHFAFVKDYPSKEGYAASHHETAYLLVKGRPLRPKKPLRDVLPWDYTGNILVPTQKPVSVIKKLVEAFSKPGDLVLDPFAGSSTTGIAARECGRNYILIEKVWECYRIAHHRLTSETLP